MQKLAHTHTHTHASAFVSNCDQSSKKKRRELNKPRDQCCHHRAPYTSIGVDILLNGRVVVWHFDMNIQCDTFLRVRPRVSLCATTYNACVHCPIHCPYDACARLPHAWHHHRRVVVFLWIWVFLNVTHAQKFSVREKCSKVASSWLSLTLSCSPTLPSSSPYGKTCHDITPSTIPSAY